MAAKQLLDVHFKNLTSSSSPVVIKNKYDDNFNNQNNQTMYINNCQSFGDQYHVQSNNFIKKLEDANKCESNNKKRKADFNGGVRIQNGDTGRRVAKSFIGNEQLAVLRDYYEMNKFPIIEEYHMIANITKLPIHVVQVWFKNLRAKENRKYKMSGFIKIPSNRDYHHQQQHEQQNLSLEQPLDLSIKKFPIIKKDCVDTEDAPLVINKEPIESKNVVTANNVITIKRLLRVLRKIKRQCILAQKKKPQIIENKQKDNYFCDQCYKKFSERTRFDRHVKEHSRPRQFKCEECPFAFKRKHHLTEHKRLHTGEKPFECSKCLKRFSHSGSYSQHMNHRYSYCTEDSLSFDNINNFILAQPSSMIQF